MAVIPKKEEKVAAVVAGLGADFTFEQFKAAFVVSYPKDWDRINRTYREHEAATKPRKSHPMPEPTQYLRNALNVYLRSTR